MDKEAHQLAIFKLFVESIPLSVDPNSIQSLQPPMPDISCSINGQKHFFELTRGADQGIADDIGKLASSTNTTDVGEFRCFNDEHILVEAVEKKASKQYETNGCPVDLLVYFDGLFHYPGYMATSELQPTLDSLQERFKNKWRHIWFYDYANNEHLY